VFGPLLLFARVRRHACREAEADRVAKQIDSLNTKAEIASERYNLARVRYESVTADVVVAKRKVAKIQSKMRYRQGHLNTRVSQMYRQGPLNFVEVLVSSRSFDVFESTIRVLTDLNNQDATMVSELKDLKAQAKKAQDVLVAKQNLAREHKRAMADNAAEVKSQLASRKKLLASLSEEIQKLLAKQLASQGSSEQARTMATLMRTRTASSGGITFGGAQAPNAKAAAAVYWAETQIGKPYVWAAAGPDTYDCSGLMLWAYDKVGIQLTHYSGDQFNQGKRIARADLAPGDLVFFGSPIHHVGMYAGGDNFIEAPFTGENVRVARFSSRGDFAGGCRPTE
jgi:peptidoglycan DL-endopeptidase CwlO